MKKAATEKTTDRISVAISPKKMTANEIMNIDNTKTAMSEAAMLRI